MAGRDVMAQELTTQDPITKAFDQITRRHVAAAMDMIDRHGEAWAQDTTGRRRPVSRYLRVDGRAYPLKATGYLAAQIAGGLTRTEGNPVKVDRIVRCFCRLGYDVT